MQSLSDQLISALKKYSSIIIVIKGSPDPDAMASAYAVKAICDTLGLSSRIIATKKISLVQNKVFIKKLDIPVQFEKKIPESDQFDAYVVTDHPSPFVEGLTDKIPCAAHIDHHEPKEKNVAADFVLIDREAGSTCTLISLLLRDMDIGLSPEAMTSIATALLYGIHTDTDKYSHASQIDYDALHYISKYSDNDLIYQISNLPLSKSTLNLLKTAMESYITYKDWLITGIGFVDETQRDNIAIIADFLLKSEKIPTVIVYAVIRSHDKNSLTLDASFRSDSDHLNLNDIIKEITTEGGARKFKGAYQVNMDYFAHCPDHEMLWTVIKQTTEEILKKRRDGIYLTELKGLYNKVRERWGSFFTGNQ